MSARGRRFTFHGAFGTKAAARKKERAVGGFIQPRVIRGRKRFIVMTENPKKWDVGERVEFRRTGRTRVLPAHRHLNIPGEVTEIRYRRTGSQKGNYYHPFKGGVKMIANADGSVTLRGRRRIHADDREPGFWKRYGHGHGRSNPMAQGKIFGMDPFTLALVAVGGYFLYQHLSAQSASAFWEPGSPQDALAAQRAGERDTTLADPLAAQRAGERDTTLLATTTDISLAGDQPEWMGVPL